MLNVSGHLISTAEVESVLIENTMVAETAVVAHPHPVKGECLYCFITMKDVSLLCLILLCIIKNMQACLFQDFLNDTRFSLFGNTLFHQKEVLKLDMLSNCVSSLNNELHWFTSDYNCRKYILFSALYASQLLYTQIYSCKYSSLYSLLLKLCFIYNSPKNHN